LKKHPHDPTLYEYVNSPEIARGYDNYHRGNRLFELDRRFLEEVLPPRGHILDIGCGTGRILVYLKEKGYTVAGIDLSRHMLNAAREKLGDETALVRADMAALPLAARCMDGCVMMFSVIGMLKGYNMREKALKEAWRVLRPGGVIAVHVHNRYKNIGAGVSSVVKASLGSLFGGGEIMRNYRGLPGLYLHLFSRGELQRLLESAGFKITRECAVSADRSGLSDAKGLAWGADGFLAAAVRKG